MAQTQYRKCKSTHKEGGALSGVVLGQMCTRDECGWLYRPHIIVPEGTN